ncbi:alpha/beta fold hydrolase [Paenibacillus sp. 1P07SE]|uniref:alpha/beta fold hydrolase n=1 Tax=Paenibacillus sp. 1P07SE TaxID=3132209 RepID=UPI0039A720AE
MKKKLLWTGVIIITLVIGVLGFVLFYDDGSLSGFVSAESEAEFKTVYEEAMQHLPVPVETRTIVTSFGEVRLYKFQEPAAMDETPLLLLPGKSASTPMWEANLADLIRERPVYTIDLLGEPGLSVEQVRIEDNEDQAIWLREVIAALDEPRLHLLGLSFGGWSAVNVMLQEDVPQVASLILVDPVHVFGPIPLKMVLVSIPASLPIVPQSIRERMLSYIAGGAVIDEDDPTARLIETGMRAFKSKLPMPTEFKKEDLTALSLPVLAIIAGSSTIHHPEQAEAAAREGLTHPSSEVLVIEEASHAINGEYPAELAAAIDAFILAIE